MKEFECDICETVFDNSDKLQRHYDRIHNNTDKLFYCNICTKSFRVKKDLATQIKAFHEGQKDIKCES